MRLTVYAEAVALMQGQSKSLFAEASYADGSVRDVTSQATWTSSNADVVTLTGAEAFAAGDGSATVTAEFQGRSDQVTLTVRHYHRVFFTSTGGTGNLATWADAGGQTGLAAADAVCQARARAVGLPGQFRAWMSDSNDDAYCRMLGLSGTLASSCGQVFVPYAGGPWVRMDGFPFSDGILGLAEGKVLSPVQFDERGTPLSARALAGTTIQGRGDARNCLNWTSSSAQEKAMGCGSDATSCVVILDCSLEQRLLCMEVGAGVALPSFASEGKKVFATSVAGSGNLSSWADAGGQTGIAAGDAICRARAAAAGLARASSFKAWLSDASMDAKDRLTSDGPWVRLDGVKVATSKADLCDGSTFTSIDVDEAGRYLVSSLVWTGTRSNGTRAMADVAHDTCDGWTSADPGTSGRVGHTVSANSSWTSMSSFLWTPACNEDGRLFCFEDD